MATDPRLKRYARILRPAPQYPVWSVQAIALGAMLVIAITATLVLVVGHANLLRELELTLAICALFLFLFLTIGLYRGARVKRKHLPDTNYKAPPLENTMDATTVDPVDVPAGDDVAGCLLSLVLSILLSLFAGVLLWAMIQFGGWLIVGFFFALCWVMYRALRIVFSRSRQCRGNLGKSVAYAALHTVLYLGWLFVVLQMAIWLRP